MLLLLAEFLVFRQVCVTRMKGPGRLIWEVFLLWICTEDLVGNVFVTIAESLFIGTSVDWGRFQSMVVNPYLRDPNWWGSWGRQLCLLQLPTHGAHVNSPDLVMCTSCHDAQCDSFLSCLMWTEVGLFKSQSPQAFLRMLAVTAGRYV